MSKVRDTAADIDWYIELFKSSFRWKQITMRIPYNLEWESRNDPVENDSQLILIVTFLEKTFINGLPYNIKIFNRLKNMESVINLLDQISKVQLHILSYQHSQITTHIQNLISIPTRLWTDQIQSSIFKQLMQKPSMTKVGNSFSYFSYISPRYDGFLDSELLTALGANIKLIIMNHTA